VQCLVDEQSAETGAIDEQVASSTSPESSLMDSMNPDDSATFTSTIFPSMRLTPKPSANLRRNFAYRPASMWKA
jgi:hypothetical protein